jgi:hypothetical protein
VHRGNGPSVPGVPQVTNLADIILDAVSRMTDDELAQAILDAAPMIMMAAGEGQCVTHRP